MGYLHVGCASLVGLVFLVSAAAKARDLDGFAASIPGLLPPWARIDGPRRLAVLVVVLEALVPVAAAVPRTRPFGLALACVLLGAFSAAIGRVLAARGPRVTCRCFGVESAPVGRRHLVRNGVLLAAAGSGLATSPDSAALAGALVAAAAGAAAAILIVSLDDLVDLLTGSP